VNPDTQKGHNITLLCQYAHVPRSSYYKWLRHDVSNRKIENQAIVAYMIELEEQHHYIFGVERLTMYINQNTPYHVSHNRVRRLMHQNNIEAAIRVKQHNRHQEHKEQISANLLYDPQTGHDFHPKHTNTVWVTDCSELRYGSHLQHKLRLSVIKDLYDHSVIAWQVADTETAELVTNTLDLALLQLNGVKPETMHSDQGSAYTGGAYSTVLAGNGIQHSMSRAGTPGDNSPMESFWSHMKDEFFAYHKASSKTELITLINQYIYWYNNERLQQTLNGMTPEKYRNHAIQNCA